MADEDRKQSDATPSPAPAPAKKPAEDDVEEADVYTAEVVCKCGRRIAANAWFCPQCGRPYLINMLFALIVLATGFALLNQLVLYIVSLFSRHSGPTMPGR